MTRKKWAVKENFEYVVKLATQEIGDDEIQKHLNVPYHSYGIWEIYLRESKTAAIIIADLEEMFA